ncbi:hypothetical protein GEMRC1_013985 [Eukaryota sp. GEM-RC1]
MSIAITRPNLLAKLGVVILLALGIWHLWLVEWHTPRNDSWPYPNLNRFGSLLGWIALFGMVFQIGLGTRNKFIDRLIGLDYMWLVHRWLPILIISFVIFHGFFRNTGRTGFDEWFEQLEDVFEVVIPEEGSPRYENNLRKVSGQLSMYSMIVLSVLSYLRKLPGRGRWGNSKGIVPWYIWRVAHFGFYYSIVSGFHHVRGQAFSASSGLTWAGDRATVYYALMFLTFYFGLQRVVVLFTQGRQGKLYVVNQTEELSSRVTRILLSPADCNSSAAQYDAGSFVIINRPDKNPFKQTPHPLSVASLDNSNDIELIIGAGANIAKEAKSWTPGTAVRVDGVYGRFAKALMANQNVTMLAGGVGMAPILSLLRYIESVALRKKEIGTNYFIPKLGLVLGVRCPEELKAAEGTLINLLKLSEEGYLDFTMQLLMDNVENEESVVEDLRKHYRVGLVKREDLEKTVPANAACYICGPTPFVKVCKKIS